jgi:predicted DCC family thiol-disulfide oxidoreductase YuxK
MLVVFFCAAGLVPYVLPRRAVLAAAASAATFSPVFTAPADADTLGTFALIESVGQLSLQVRSLQFFVRDAAEELRETAGGSSGPLKAGYDLLRKRVASDRPILQSMSETMVQALPDLRICAPEQASCECEPDPLLMRAAAQQVELVQEQLRALDAALVGPDAFEPVSNVAAPAWPGRLIASYPGGEVERALEEMCEAADTFLDLTTGRPLMTARIATRSPALPASAAAAAPALGPLARAMTPEVERALCADDAVGPPSMAALCRPLPEVRRAPSPSLCASTGEARRLFPQELNLLYDSKCAVCRWEVDFLSARDSEGKLTYTDVESPEYDETAARNGRVDYGTALASFHAVRSDGEVLRGMQVFQEAYKAVGLGWVWAIYENPVAHAILDAGYGLFARCRTYLTRGTSLEALNAARRARRADLTREASGLDARGERT